MREPTDICIRMLRGDTCARSLFVRRGGVPLMLDAGDRGRLCVFGEGSTPVVSRNVLPSDQRPDGAIPVLLEPEDTQSLAEGDYRLELELRLADGTVVTPLHGTLRIIGDYITPEVRDAQP